MWKRNYREAKAITTTEKLLQRQDGFDESISCSINDRGAYFIKNKCHLLMNKVGIQVVKETRLDSLFVANSFPSCRELKENIYCLIVFAHKAGYPSQKNAMPRHSKGAWLQENQEAGVSHWETLRRMFTDYHYLWLVYIRIWALFLCYLYLFVYGSFAFVVAICIFWLLFAFCIWWLFVLNIYL